MPKRVNIHIDEKTHTQAKVISVLKNTTLNEYFEKAIEEAVKRDLALLDKLRKK